jgi:hypothetical protein
MIIRLLRWQLDNARCNWRWRRLYPGRSRLVRRTECSGATLYTIDWSPAGARRLTPQPAIHNLAAAQENRPRARSERSAISATYRVTGDLRQPIEPCSGSVRPRRLAPATPPGGHSIPRMSKDSSLTAVSPRRIIHAA